MIKKDFSQIEEERAIRITQMHLLFKKYVMKQNFGKKSMFDYDGSERVLFGGEDDN